MCNPISFWQNVVGITKKKNVFGRIACYKGSNGEGGYIGSYDGGCHPVDSNGKPLPNPCGEGNQCNEFS